MSDPVAYVTVTLSMPLDTVVDPDAYGDAVGLPVKSQDEVIGRVAAIEVTNKTIDFTVVIQQGRHDSMVIEWPYAIDDPKENNLMDRNGLIDRWVRQAKREGWEVVRTKRHYRLYPPDKRVPPVTLPSSPGHGRSMLNARAGLRRAGLDVEI